MSTRALSTAYRGNPTWWDMSEYAVHFTKPANGLTAYDVLLSILGEGFIRPTGPIGAARKLNGQLRDSQLAACFSEIPLDLLDRLVQRRSQYGIGFRQDFLTTNGGARVWYLDKDGPASTAFSESVRGAMRGGINPDDPIWRLTPCVDYPGDYGETQYRFEWEREWRVPSGLAFTPNDVAFLFIPEAWHDTARAFFEAQQTGPAYLCPYVDPSWGRERIETVFEAICPPPAVVSEALCLHCGGYAADGRCLQCGELS